MELTEKQRERFKKIMIWVLIVYLLLVAGFYFFQHLFFFHPKTLPADYTFHFKEKFIEKEIKPDPNSVTDIVRFLPADSPKGVVLYFHGNRDNIERYAGYSQIFTQQDYECWMVDYPGFGKSTGKLTAANMLQQANHLYVLALSMFKKEQVVIYGKSMGTGPATYLAANRPCSRLILETPYYSLSSLARSFAPILPVSWLIKVDFDNGENLKSVHVPVTIFHGTDDKTVPYSNAAKLKPLMKPGDSFISIDGGQHNGIADFPQYKATIDSLL